MPEPIKRAVIQKINVTRQGPSGSKWKPSKDAVICNIHYLDFKGPSKENKDSVPVYFKRPNSYTALPPPKKRRVIVKCATSTTAEDVYNSNIEHQNDDHVVPTEITYDDLPNNENDNSPDGDTYELLNDENDNSPDGDADDLPNDENDNSPDRDAAESNSANHINLRTGELDTEPEPTVMICIQYSHLVLM